MFCMENLVFCIQYNKTATHEAYSMLPSGFSSSESHSELVSEEENLLALAYVLRKFMTTSKIGVRGIVILSSWTLVKKLLSEIFQW